MDNKLKKELIKPIVQAKAEGDVFILTLSGDVGKPSLFFYGDIYAELVREYLDDVTTDIVIRLNSYGGEIFEGIEIYNYLKSHSSHITVEVTGIAASAASVIAMGADKVLMCTGSQMMIHRASTTAWGNDEELEKVVASLKKSNQSMVEIYSNKTQQDTEQIINWMKDESFFSAEEAIQFGFADGMANQIEDTKENDDLESLINSAVAKAVAKLNATVETPKEPEIEKPKSLLENLLNTI